MAPLPDGEGAYQVALAPEIIQVRRTSTFSGPVLATVQAWALVTGIHPPSQTEIPTSLLPGQEIPMLLPIGRQPGLRRTGVQLPAAVQGLEPLKTTLPETQAQ